MRNVTIATFDEYNFRRYSTPWVCKMTNGEYDFSTKVGIYTGDGRQGEAGDLVVYEPVDGQVYAYGQKDYRGGNTKNKKAIWSEKDKEFFPCDKLGRIKK